MKSFTRRGCSRVPPTARKGRLTVVAVPIALDPLGQEGGLADIDGRAVRADRRNRYGPGTTGSFGNASPPFGVSFTSPAARPWKATEIPVIGWRGVRAPVSRSLPE